MLFSTVAIAALAGQVVVAEGVRKPYKPELARMSVKAMLLGKRQEDGGYEPDTTFCGTGTTCAEACGAGYQQCSSSDDQVHCFDAASSQTCCPNNSGDSCDAGYYCSADTTGATYCCPNGSSVEDCAATFSVTGGLSSQIPGPTLTTTLTSTSISTVVVPRPTTTTSFAITSTAAVATTSSSVVISTSSEAVATSTTEECTTYTSEIVHTIIPASGTTSYNATTVKGTGYWPTSSTPAVTTLPVQAGASSTQASFIVVMAAVAIAALL
ncbi:hypothetical protein BKA67DRAFT_652581 [Truncatella angustata]|uniref:Uncharacterized protein n=1 Tax=Truncatella angustata TaxID=152316 RepID=A0A9P8UVZ3_9PEZI|nr:uncharacterized protein BKA67DRAFT_652581 [Truncatella angustata]KAH6659350.1 hypothetical protein BKA67DRAFT_652581 [Truncatella angustata]KAH8199142.1 hypothetical protein TruAng_006673 [Truncatella angustata]